MNSQANNHLPTHSETAANHWLLAWTVGGITALWLCIAPLRSTVSCQSSYCFCEAILFFFRLKWIQEDQEFKVIHWLPREFKISLEDRRTCLKTKTKTKHHRVDDAATSRLKECVMLTLRLWSREQSRTSNRARIWFSWPPKARPPKVTPSIPTSGKLTSQVLTRVLSAGVVRTPSQGR